MKAILGMREDVSNKLWERGTGTQQAYPAPPGHVLETQGMLWEGVLCNTSDQ